MNGLAMRRVGSLVLIAVVVAILAGADLGHAQCSRPVSEGSGPVIRDCIYIARAGVGLEDCVHCLRDVDGSGDVHGELTQNCREN